MRTIVFAAKRGEENADAMTAQATIRQYARLWL